MSRTKSGLKGSYRLVIATCLLAVLAGCNTVSGIGRDLESVGDSVSDAADGAK